MKSIKFLSLGLLLSLVGVCSAQNKQQEMSEKNNTMVEHKVTQTQALEERKANFTRKADANTKKIYQEGLVAVSESGVVESARNVGDTAPNFILKNALGKEVSLQDYLDKGPVVLVWYRGGWCPYCNLNLHYLQEALPQIKAQGANLVALTPELPDQSISTSEKNELEFEVLSDVGNVVAKDYGVVFTLTDDVAKKYNKSFGLNEHNGDTSNELPLAVTYIIGTDGIIEYAFLDADYRKRAEPTEIVSFLEKME